MKVRVYIARVWGETFNSEINNLNEEVIQLFCGDYNLKDTEEIRKLIISSMETRVI